MPDELKEGDDVMLRGKIQYRNPSIPNACIVKGKHFSYSILERDLVKVRPGTYEVTTRELVKMLAKLFRYKRLMAEIIAHDGRLNKMLQIRARRFFRARLKELRRKRGGR